MHIASYMASIENFYEKYCILTCRLIQACVRSGISCAVNLLVAAGEKEETRYAIDYMEPAWNETIMDLSCGSGLFSRQFIKSGKFKNVIAADFSENMLKQTSRFIQEDKSIDPG